MTKHLSCPLKGYPCAQQYCAWWDGVTECCANVAMIDVMRELAGQIDKLTFMLNADSKVSPAGSRSKPRKTKVKAESRLLKSTNEKCLALLPCLFILA